VRVPSVHSVGASAVFDNSGMGLTNRIDTEEYAVRSSMSQLSHGVEKG
jgi:hypothetical protein